MSPTDCPAAEDLGAFLVGKLAVGRYDDVAAHLDTCSRCQTRLGELREARVRFQAALPFTEPADPFASEAGCASAQASVERLLHGILDVPSARATVPPVQIDPIQLGPYRILKKLGQGGMGAVYQALHTRLKRAVAIKVLATHRLGDPTALARFQREIEAVGRLDHPHLVAAHDANEDQGIHYLVTEYIEGLDLAQLVQRCGPLPVPEACALICQAAVGLHYAHGQGLIHRDIKPSNLMLTLEHATLTATPTASSQTANTPTALVKILDLGLALLHEDSTDAPELTSVERVMGTLDYMAPEQATDSHHVDVRADVYALGATLFKLLTGQAPLASRGHDTQWKKLLALAGAEVPPIKTVRDDLPSGLAAVVDRMLARDRERRYATALQVAEALRPFTRGADLTALFKEARARESSTAVERVRPSQPGNQAKKLPRFARWEVVLGGLLLLALLAAVILRQPRRFTEPDGKPAAVWRGWPADAPAPACARFTAAEAQQVQAAWAKYLGVPVAWENAIGMQFRLIPPGEFVMGSSAEEIDDTLRQVDQNLPRWLAATRSEAPQHRVVLTTPFYLGSHEVTQQQYATVLETRPSYFAATGPGKDVLPAGGTDWFPVDTVNWLDAHQFCARLSAREGDRPGQESYRLPTEAEWEFACRAGTTTRFWNGDRDEDLMQTGWFGRNAGYRTHAVGELQPNPFGLYDMHGNVWEWTQDAWEPTFYQQAGTGLAVDPWNQAANANGRVIRGGDWNFVAAVCRSGHRHIDPPTSRNRYLGFRVVLPVVIGKR